MIESLHFRTAFYQDTHKKHCPHCEGSNFFSRSIKYHEKSRSGMIKSHKNHEESWIMGKNGWVCLFLQAIFLSQKLFFSVALLIFQHGNIAWSLRGPGILWLNFLVIPLPLISPPGCIELGWIGQSKEGFIRQEDFGQNSTLQKWSQNPPMGSFRQSFDDGRCHTENAKKSALGATK